MCLGTTSRSRFLSRSCMGKPWFDLFLSDPVIFSYCFQAGGRTAAVSVQYAALCGDVSPTQISCEIWWGIYAGIICCLMKTQTLKNSLLLFRQMKMLFCSFWMLCKWSTARSECFCPHTVFDHLWPHTDKLSLLPTECRFTRRAWEHLYSLVSSFLLQLTDSRVITGLSLIITNISPYASGQTHIYTTSLAVNRRDDFI